MVTVLKAAGMRFAVLTDDHQPSHCHVYNNDGEAKIDLLRLAVLSNRGMKQPDLNRALALVMEHRQVFLDTWRKFHG